MTAHGTASGAAAELDAGRAQKRPAQIMANDAGRSAANGPPMISATSVTLASMTVTRAFVPDARE